MINIQLILVTIYFLISYFIFKKVYSTSNLVIDEEFHIRQAKEYCKGNFHVWDPKITTFPGLYLLSYVLVPYKFCTTFYLRLVVLIASTLNVSFVYQILKIKFKKPNQQRLIALNALNIAILPPMYFFAHIFYTDVVSVTTVLGLYYFWLISMHKIAFLWGIASVLMRQTNIVWIGMMVGTSCLDELNRFVKKSKTKNCENSLKEIFQSIIVLISNPNDFIKFIKLILKKFWMYALIIIGFIIFLYFNKSIVVGDKSAHTANLHIPQILYYCLFVAFFGCCMLLPHLKITITIMRNNKWSTLIIAVVCFVVIKYNTIEHPYLLADNRHYTFYVWTRFYGKYNLFKYLMIPAYIFALFSVARSLQTSVNFNFQLMYYVSTILVLVLQSLIEIRYFIIPFLFLRLNSVVKNKFLIILEFCFYVIINAITFYIFFTKEIYWKNFDYIQRLIW